MGIEARQTAVPTDASRLTASANSGIEPRHRTVSIDSERILEGLNDAQREAVLHSGGPLLVVAGAGSGKTRVLTHRIANLIANHGIHPNSILAITFTNKAASEMQRRVQSLVGDVAERMWVSTFHSACVRILRSEAKSRGYKSNFSIYDQSDSVRLVQYVLRDLDYDAKKFPPKKVASIISSAKADLIDFETFAEKSRGGDLVEKVAGDVYSQYQKRLFAANAMDFDDLLMLTYEIFKSDSEAIDRWKSRFSHVLVDEYQDTNRAQAQIAFLLSQDHRNICVVGDADQSIYSWRKADIRNILDFERHFPGAKVVLLERNYRSTKPILDAANAVIANNRSRKPKDLWTEIEDGEPIYLRESSNERDEASWIVSEILRLVKGKGESYSDVAVFYRTNSQSRAIEEQLVSWTIPYQVLGGVKFYDRKEIKDILAYIRLVVNHSDEVSLKRVINVPRRGIGDTTIAKLEKASKENNLSLYEACELAQEFGISTKTAKSISQFLEMISSIAKSSSEGLGVSETIEHLLEECGYLEDLESEPTAEADMRRDNIMELVGMAANYSSLEEMMEAVTLVSDSDSMDSSSGKVVLMTIHTAKGLEFDNVFMVGMEEGMFPHGRSMGDNNSIEEERRLAYVGITRARKRLYISYASSRGLWGDTLYNQRSRFIDEIPQELIQEV